MCGISGIINNSNWCSYRLTAHYITDQLTHRGNDHKGVALHVDSNIHFGHNRLSIIDLSDKGNQPLSGFGYTITYNGEIYNYKDFYSGNGNDAYALLESLRDRGVEHTCRIINGMFAFAAFNERENKLHLCVDRFAQKPLYYYQDNDVFAFASSPNALLHLKDKWRINERALLSYWALGSVMGEQSIWDGIKKVEGSTIVTYDIDSKQVSQQRYWQPQHIDNAIGIMGDLIIDAIDAVKVSDVPVHIFLSGGIDSTLVASRFQGGHAVHMESNETHYAQMVADKFGITLNIADPLSIDIPNCIRDYSAKCGEPSMAGIIPYITAQEVAKHAKVAVTANGADELFFGYDRTQDHITQAQLQYIYRSGFVFDFKPHTIDERLSAGRWLELQAYVQYDLNKTLDFASMAHTVEMRAPFLDHRLVEAALSIPQSYHIRGNERKVILKDILRKLGFDDSFLNRAKQGFSMNIAPVELANQKAMAYKWCIDNGFLKLPQSPNGRDLQYLQMSALGFYYWHETFKNKII